MTQEQFSRLLFQADPLLIVGDSIKFKTDSIECLLTEHKSKDVPNHRVKTPPGSPQINLREKNITTTQ